jgi:hypothetical protein
MNFVTPFICLQELVQIVINDQIIIKSNILNIGVANNKIFFCAHAKTWQLKKYSNHGNTKCNMSWSYFMRILCECQQLACKKWKWVCYVLIWVQYSFATSCKMFPH